MGFEDLERQLKKILKTQKVSTDPSVRARIRMQILEKFAEHYQSDPNPFWKRIFAPKTSILAFAAVSIFILFNAFPVIGNKLSAGQIVPKFGLVEIVRDGEIILVREKTPLRIGDTIRVGNRAEAEITLPEKFISTAKTRTELRVVDRGKLFLEQGALENQVVRGGEISTNRGMIKSFPGATFEVTVSESGETRIVLKKNQVSVTGWQNGEIMLREGEELRLRTDTKLLAREMPQDLKLSTAQLLAIRSKLIIARTKLLNGIEKSLARNDDRSAEKDFRSAQKTFLSIVQVLKSSRNLEITKRENIDLIKNHEVFARLSQKIDDVTLLTEVQALETLFGLIETNHTSTAFSIPRTSVKSFDRFVILDRIFQLGTPQQRKLGEALKQRYVIAFLRKVLNEELKIDQVSILNQGIAELPKTKIARDFLVRVKNLFAPDLAALLNEKIESVF